MNDKTYAYCQNSTCMKHFKRVRGEVLGDFITCSKDCEKKLVQRNPEFLVPLWQEKYLASEGVTTVAVNE